MSSLPICNMPFGFDQPEDSPGYLLWQVTMMWQREIRAAIESYNVSHAQFVIMATLLWFNSQKTDVTQILIVNHTKLDKMTVSKSLKGLALLGFVSRIENEIDTRAKNVTLTQKGKDILNLLIPLVENIDSKFFNIGSETEKNNFTHFLRKIITENNKNNERYKK